MKENYILKILGKDERLDGRKLIDFREIEVEVNPISRAEGSARVNMGKTEVLVGVKLDFGSPFPDTPNEGMIRHEVELTPLACEDFESGPPGEDAIELARVVDRAVRESHCIDLGDLCIEPGEKVWSVSIDMVIMNHDGNLIDAATLGAMVALSNAQMPKIKDDKIVREDYEKPLPMSFKSLNVTVCKVGDKFLVDPTREEENIVDTKMVVGVRDDGKIVSTQKIGTGALTENDIYEMIDIGVKKSKELLKKVKTVGKKDTKPKAKANKSRKS